MNNLDCALATARHVGLNAVSLVCFFAIPAAIVIGLYAAGCTVYYVVWGCALYASRRIFSDVDDTDIAVALAPVAAAAATTASSVVADDEGGGGAKLVDPPRPRRQLPRRNRSRSKRRAASKK